MSFEEVIEEVHKRPEIWQLEHPAFKDRTVTNRIWNEIADKLGIEDHVLRKRWKHLKDHFRKELKKTILKAEANHYNQQSRWKYYNSLLFMKDEVITAKVRDNLESSIQSVDSDDNDQQSTENQTKCVPKFIYSSSSTPAFSPMTAKKRAANNSADESLKKKVLVTEKRINDEDEVKSDEDYLFFMSLLPTMRKLSSIQKLLLRGKINDWLIEAITKSEYSNT